jgi:hypothetical protein
MHNFEISMANEIKAFTQSLFKDIDLSNVRFLSAIGCNRGALGECFVYADDNNIIDRIRILLYADEIAEDALALGIEYNTYLIETIYHELIHAMHAIIHDGLDEMHEQSHLHHGELWDSFIVIGRNKGIINRSEI